MKHLFCLALASMGLSPLFAQVSIGNRAGVSLSHEVSDDDDLNEQLEKDKNTLLGFAAAMVVEVKVKDYLAFQTEFAITQKGHQIKEPKQDGYFRQRTNYGEGQLLAKGILGKGTAKLNILAGGSFGRGLVGIERGANNTLDTIGNINFLDETSQLRDFGPGEDELNRVEWSLIAGLGATFDLGPKTRVFVEGRYVHGLTSIFNDAKTVQIPPGVFNRCILIQFGYFVQLNEAKPKTVPKTDAPQY